VQVTASVYACYPTIDKRDTHPHCSGRDDGCRDAVRKRRDCWRGL